MLRLLLLAITACTPGYVCLYRHEGYSGGQIDFQAYIPDLSLHTFEGTSIAGHAQVSSTINLGTYYNACLFDDTDGKGKSLELARTNHTYNLNRYYSMTVHILHTSSLTRPVG